MMMMMLNLSEHPCSPLAALLFMHSQCVCLCSRVPLCLRGHYTLGIGGGMFFPPLLGNYHSSDAYHGRRQAFHCERCGMKEADLRENKDIRQVMLISPRRGGFACMFLNETGEKVRRPLLCVFQCEHGGKMCVCLRMGLCAEVQIKIRAKQHESLLCFLSYQVKKRGFDVDKT